MKTAKAGIMSSLLLMSVTVACGQSKESSNTGQVAVRVPGTVTNSPSVAKQWNKTVYASQLQGPSDDVGKAINAAIAKLPVIGKPGVPTGVVSLEGYQGIQELTTPILLNSHSVSITGPGKTSLTLNCVIAKGDCIRITDTAFGTGNWINGPSIGGFSLVGHGTPGVVGIHAGDMFRLRMQDILVFGFRGTGGIGIWFDNQRGYTEQLNLTDVQVSNNATGMRFSNTGGTQDSQSFGYGTYVNVFLQVGAGQTALTIDGGTASTLPLIYHSNINWIFEDLRPEPGQTNTFINMSPNSAMLENTYSIFLEDQGQNGGNWLYMGNNSVITGFGNIQGWCCRTISLGNNAIFNVQGRVEIARLNWSPVASHILPSGSWGDSAAISDVTGQFQFFTFTVTAGTRARERPTVTVAFPSANGQHTWRNAPLYMCKQVGGTGTLPFNGENTATTTSMVLTFNGTPTTGSTYVITCQGAAK